MRQLKVRIGAMMRFAKVSEGLLEKLSNVMLGFRNAVGHQSSPEWFFSGTILLIIDVIGLHKCDTHS